MFTYEEVYQSSLEAVERCMYWLFKKQLEHNDGYMSKLFELVCVSRKDSIVCNTHATAYNAYKRSDCNSSTISDKELEHIAMDNIAKAFVLDIADWEDALLHGYITVNVVNKAINTARERNEHND